MIKLFLKAVLILRNKLIRHRKIKNPKLFMTILAKNEGDIIEKQIIFHKHMGVDGFIVTDNNSTDNTLDIFKKYQEKGWIKEIILESNNNYDQVKWVDRMINIARSKYHADWIINADADEFWCSDSGCLKNELKETTSNNLLVNIYNVFPENENDFYLNDKLIVNVDSLTNELKSKLSKFSLYNKQINKVIHRGDGYLSISNGNHSVKMKMKSTALSKDITIYHYNLRSLEHFKNKMINGGAAVNNNKELPPNSAQHWIYFHNIFVNQGQGYLGEYKKVTGVMFFRELDNLGIFIKGDKVKKFFAGTKND